MTAKSSRKSIKSNVPQLRHHKATGQAYAVVNQKTVYFGRFDDPESAKKYHQYMAEWLAAGKHAPMTAGFRPEGMLEEEFKSWKAMQH